MKIILLTVVFLLLCCSLYEIYWRRKGILPSVEDNKLLWGLMRHRLYKNSGKEKIVTVGSSRSQIGIDPEAIEQTFPRFKAIQLSINGVSSLYTMKDLCDYSLFTGIIIFGLSAADLIPTIHQNAKPWSDFYHAQIASSIFMLKRLRISIQVWFQDTFIWFSSNFGFKKKLFNPWKLHPLYITLHKNRFHTAHCRKKLSREKLQLLVNSRIVRATEGCAPTLIDYFPMFKLAINSNLTDLYRKLRKWEGQTILVRMPTS